MSPSGCPCTESHSANNLLSDAACSLHAGPPLPGNVTYDVEPYSLHVSRPYGNVVIVVVPVLDTVLVTDDVTVDDKDVVAVVLTLDVCVDVTVVRSHVRPDPSNKLLIAKFNAATSVLQAEAASTVPSELQVSSPRSLFTKSPTWNSLMILLRIEMAASHDSADECLITNPSDVFVHAKLSVVEPPHNSSISSN